MKPTIPKGTRDFSPDEMARRNFIFETIRNVYQRYGYQQIETPSMENLSTLEGKYGEEGDRLLFRVLNSGIDFTQISKTQELKISDLTEKGLRYDLTVPFARFVVMHRNEITFPFKRYQIQPVWRADRPQKNRYREFYQCDADVIGSDSLLNEAELIKIIQDVFAELKIEMIIKLNNRKILAGIAEVIGEKQKIIDITVAIDKLDKVGLEKVNEELRLKGLTGDAITRLQPIINLKGNTEEKLRNLEAFLSGSDIGKKGIEETATIISLSGNSNLELDTTLARGLNYYTGAIIEVKAKNIQMGSLCGGGRYDDLTGIFGLPDVSGVGISFGADRIYDILEETNAFPDTGQAFTKILFVNFGDAETKHCLTLLNQLRKEGVNAELYPDTVKMKKQLSYADDKKIPYVALIGSEEMKSGKITVKTLKSGEQSELSMSELLQLLRK